MNFKPTNVNLSQEQIADMLGDTPPDYVWATLDNQIELWLCSEPPPGESYVIIRPIDGMAYIATQYKP